MVLDAATDNETFTVDRRRARHAATAEEVRRVFLAETNASDAVTATPRPYCQDA